MRQLRHCLRYLRRCPFYLRHCPFNLQRYLASLLSRLVRTISIDFSGPHFPVRFRLSQTVLFTRCTVDCSLHLNQMLTSPRPRFTLPKITVVSFIHYLSQFVLSPVNMTRQESNSSICLRKDRVVRLVFCICRELNCS